MPKANDRFCKIFGSCTCLDPEQLPDFGLAIHVLTAYLNMSRILRVPTFDLESESVRFLCGESVLVDRCSLVFCVPESMANEDGSPKEELVSAFLKRAFGVAIEGITCPVNRIREGVQVGEAMLYVVPDSWRVMNFSPLTSGTRKLFRIGTRFSARIQMNISLKMFPLDRFKTGVCCDRFWGKPELARENLELELSLLKYKDKLYINQDCSFAMIKPKDGSEFKEVLFREMLSRAYLMYDVAEIAASLVDDSSLRSRLLKYHCEDDFMKLARISNANRHTVRRFYVPTSFVSVSLGNEWFNQKIIQETFPRFIQKLRNVLLEGVDLEKLAQGANYYELCENYFSVNAHFPNGHSVNEEQQRNQVSRDFKTVLEQVTDFGQAILEFYNRYIADRNCDKPEACDTFLFNLLDFAWEKVALDPIVYMDAKNPILSTFAYHILNGYAM